MAYRVRPFGMAAAAASPQAARYARAGNQPGVSDLQISRGGIPAVAARTGYPDREVPVVRRYALGVTGKAPRFDPQRRAQAQEQNDHR